MDTLSRTFCEMTDRNEHAIKGHHDDRLQRGLGSDGGSIVAVAHFDYDAIDRDLGFTEPEAETVKGWSERKFSAVAEGLNDLIQWIARSQTLQGAGLRAISLAFMARPDLFHANSWNELADRYGVQKQNFGRYSTELFHIAGSRFFGAHTRNTARHREYLRAVHTKKQNFDRRTKAK